MKIPYFIQNAQQTQQLEQKTIFHQNPLKLMLSNSFSGSLHIENVNYINNIYNMMKQTIQENTLSSLNYNKSISNQQNSKVESETNILKRFYKKGQKIFNIIKDSPDTVKKKSIKVIFNSYHSNNNHIEIQDLNYQKEEYMKNQEIENHQEIHEHEMHNVNEEYEVLQEEEKQESYEEEKHNLEMNDHDMINEGNILPSWLNQNLDF